MKYFTIDELTDSATAAVRGIDNTPTPEAKARMAALIDNLLDPVREVWGKPITVNSGYRSAALNKSVGGVPTSQHLSGEAADITTGSKEGNRRLFELIRDGGFDFDQLIDEKGFSWVHVSYTTARKNRRQVLKL